jgi:hypothetical protein
MVLMREQRESLESNHLEHRLMQKLHERALVTLCGIET